MPLKPDLRLSDAPVPAVHKARKPRARVIIRARTGDVAQTLGHLEPGCEIFALTNGQFSLIDVLEYALASAGDDAAIDVATWTAADGDLRRAHAFLLSGQIKSFRLVVDPSFKTRKPEFCATLVELFGNDAIRTVPLHGKFAVVSGQSRSFAIRSSMNLNPNHRMESVEISDDPALVAFLREFVDECFARAPIGNFTGQSRALLEGGAAAGDGLAFG